MRLAIIPNSWFLSFNPRYALSIGFESFKVKNILLSKLYKVTCLDSLIYSQKNATNRFLGNKNYKFTSLISKYTVNYATPYELKYFKMLAKDLLAIENSEYERLISLGNFKIIEEK